MARNPMRGADKHIARLRALGNRNAIVKIAGATVYEGADMVRARAFRLVSQGSISGKGHIASRPGDPPNRNTGELQAGFETVQTGPLSAEFSSNSKHAMPMEFGAHIRNGFGRGISFEVEERPHVRPARNIEEPRIQKLFARRIEQLVKRSGR